MKRLLCSDVERNAETQLRTPRTLSKARNREVPGNAILHFPPSTSYKLNTGTQICPLPTRKDTATVHDGAKIRTTIQVAELQTRKDNNEEERKKSIWI